MPNNEHDALFKGTFSQVEHAAGALRAALPAAVAARIDFNTLVLRPGSFVDDALTAQHTDLLFSASIAGRRALLYVLFEHQSTPDGFMPYRLLRYMIRIWEAFRDEHPDANKLPAILPVVLYQGGGGWKAQAFEELLDLDADVLAELGPYIPRFRFVLDDLDALSDDALRARAMSALGKLVLWCLKHVRQPGYLLRELGRVADVVREARDAPDGKGALERLFRYIFNQADHEITETELRELVSRAVDESVTEEVMSLAERLHEEGRRKGWLEGEQKVLLKLLDARFGRLSEAVVARVSAAGSQQLDTWTKRVLTAATLAEVLDG